jgi:S-adenosylmethionine hydrolase
MVAFEAIYTFEAASCGLATQPWKERLFFICCMPFATHVKILERSLHGRRLFAGKAASMRSLGDQTQYFKEALNPAMAVFEHANWIIESAVWFCAYLDRHGSAFLQLSSNLSIPCQKVRSQDKSIHGSIKPQH